MKLLFAALLLVTAVGSTARAAVDPGLLGLVTPDAKALIGAQVAATIASPFGRYLFSQIPENQIASQVMTLTGFDPRRDIKEILVVTGDNPSAAVILGRGSFQPDKILAAAKLAGASVSNYRGLDILFGTGNSAGTAAGRPGSLVFLDSSTVAMGDTAAVKAAIDRHAVNTVFTGALADRAKQISATNDIWFASLTPPTGIFGGAAGPGAANGAGAANSGANPVQAMLQSALQASGGIKFAATDVTVSAEVLARSPQDAQSMVDVLRFGASMIQMNRNQGTGAKSAASLLDSATFTTAGPVAKVSLALPEQQLEQLFMQQAGGKSKKIAARE